MSQLEAFALALQYHYFEPSASSEGVVLPSPSARTMALTATAVSSRELDPNPSRAMRRGAREIVKPVQERRAKMHSDAMMMDERERAMCGGRAVRGALKFKSLDCLGSSH